MRERGGGKSGVGLLFVLICNKKERVDVTVVFEYVPNCILGYWNTEKGI